MKAVSRFAGACVALALVASACQGTQDPAIELPAPDPRLALDERAAVLESWVRASALRSQAQRDGEPRWIGLMDSRAPSAGGPATAWIAALLAEGVIADFCAADPSRLRGVGMVALHDPKAAASEAARVHDVHGFRSVFARPNPILGRNLDDPAYDPLWRALSDRRMALGLHEGGMPPLPQAGADRLTNAEQRHICSHPMEQMVSAVSLIYGGVLERFPGMTVAFLEAGCGWVPFWLERMDDHYEKGLERDFGAAVGVVEGPTGDGAEEAITMRTPYTLADEKLRTASASLSKVSKTVSSLVMARRSVMRFVRLSSLRLPP